MKYNNIANQIKAEATNSLEKRIEAIKAGAPEWVMKDNLTAYRWKQYQDGRITFEQAAEIATKRATEKANKDIERKLARLEAAEQAADLESIEIHVEWKKIEPGEPTRPRQYTPKQAPDISPQQERPAAADMTRKAPP